MHVGNDRCRKMVVDPDMALKHPLGKSPREKRGARGF